MGSVFYAQLYSIVWKNSSVSGDLVLILQQIIEPRPNSLEMQPLIPT